MKLFDLDRFLTAQDNFDTYEAALQEVKQSLKETHWIWFIFPQIHGLGHSQMSEKYSLVSLLEAKAYFDNDILRKRLYEISNALYEQEEDLLKVFGRTDYIKTLSCMTLFDIVSPNDIFAKVIEKYYDGRRCRKTLEIVKKERYYNNVERPQYTPSHILSLEREEKIAYEFRPTVSDNSKEVDGKQNIEFSETSRDDISYLLGWGQVRTLAEIAKALNDKYHFKTIDDFFSSFENHLDNYLKRGTITQKAVDVLSEIIRLNSYVLFKDDYLDLEKLLYLVFSSADDDNNSPFDVIYSKMEKTKLLRLVALLNDVVRYRNVYNLYQDICSITSSCGYDNDDRLFRYLLIYFKIGVENLWDSIISDGFLNNELLEKKMFTEYEQKVANLGLEHVLETDYEISCQGAMVPKEIGTGPVFIKDFFYTDPCSGKYMYVKSCGGVSAFLLSANRYEFNMIRPILDRECDKGEYQFIRGYYIPMKDDDKPVFNADKRQVRFDDDGGKKCDFLKRMRLEIKEIYGNF